MLAVLTKFSWGLGERSPFRIFVSAGPYIGYLLSADQVLINKGQKVPGTDVDVRPELHDINAGGEGNIGLSYFFRTSSHSLQSGGNYGFDKVQRETLDGRNYSGALAVVVSYSCWFNDNFLTNGHFQPKR